MAERLGIGRTAVYTHLRLRLRTSPRWTDEEVQVLVDGYLDKTPVAQISALLPGRSLRAIRSRMCRHRKWVKKDPKKKRALSAITMALKAVRKTDIFREVTD